MNVIEYAINNLVHPERLSTYSGMDYYYDYVPEFLKYIGCSQSLMTTMSVEQLSGMAFNTAWAGYRHMEVQNLHTVDQEALTHMMGTYLLTHERRERFRSLATSRHHQDLVTMLMIADKWHKLIKWLTHKHEGNLEFPPPAYYTRATKTVQRTGVQRTALLVRHLNRRIQGLPMVDGLITVCLTPYELGQLYDRPIQTLTSLTAATAPIFIGTDMKVTFSTKTGVTAKLTFNDVMHLLMLEEDIWSAL